DPGATLSRYRIWGEDPVNRLSGDVFRRVVRWKSRLVPYEVRWQGSVDEPKLLVRVVGERAVGATDAAVSEVRRLFGLDFDLPGFYRLAKGDPALASLVEPLYRSRHTLAPTASEIRLGSLTPLQPSRAFS